MSGTVISLSALLDSKTTKTAYANKNTRSKTTINVALLVDILLSIASVLKEKVGFT